jgi:hypothetical protein
MREWHGRVVVNGHVVKRDEMTGSEKVQQLIKEVLRIAIDKSTEILDIFTMEKVNFPPE